ncbi:hypothetical protein [Deinococcus sp. Leaf326]|uniref:hypothetical protein n=1 Tax=Deinococcus sp. Leaf326 TaxID=1736338 RepID=UPI0006F35108|nr:hypothetical protein [Deinococcus sp. Leaf326]KQR41100.1 hypothetical protein ASF71_02970 [Deinococcus sp. Leaf326]
MNRAAQFAVSLALLAGFGPATAQTTTVLPDPLLPPVQTAPNAADSSVRTLIPTLIALRRPTAPLAFDISPSNFPPAQYPARYLSPSQEFSVFSSASTPWTVQLEIHTAIDEQGQAIPTDRLSYRVNGGPWIKALGVPQVVMSGVGATPGWMPLRIEVALDLQGGETGGDYDFDLTFTALVLP